MPTEVRQLLFRPVEVVRAIKDYFPTIGRTLPTGEILSCHPETTQSGEVQVRVTVALQSTTQAVTGYEEVTVSSNCLLPALIMFCRSRGVPLPASASKMLSAMKDQTCLIVRINPKRDPGLDQLMRNSTTAA